MKQLLVYAILYTILKNAWTSPLSTLPPKEIVINDHQAIEKSISENLKQENQTLAELVSKQTETVKKIVSDQSLHRTIPDYPVVTRVDNNNYRETARKEIEKLTFEELKLKCQHLARLLNASRLYSQENPKPQVGNLQSTYKPPVYEQKSRPVYIQQRPFANRYQTIKNGFYITTQTPTTRKPSPTTTTTTQAPQSETPNVKYIRLEPVILQKTILSDGRTVYYWHKSLPTAVQYPTNTYQSLNVQQQENSPEDSEEESTEQTTTPYTSWNFFPFYRSASATEKLTTTTTTSTTTSTPRPAAPLEPVFQNQLRFVIPVPIDSPNNPQIRNPWDFDQYAYYPKDLQPSTVNVQVPYQPTFHVIKTLTIPNQHQNLQEDSLENVDPNRD